MPGTLRGAAPGRERMAVISRKQGSPLLRAGHHLLNHPHAGRCQNPGSQAQAALTCVSVASAHSGPCSSRRRGIHPLSASTQAVTRKRAAAQRMAKSTPRRGRAGARSRARLPSEYSSTEAAAAARHTCEHGVGQPQPRAQDVTSSQPTVMHSRSKQPAPEHKPRVAR